MANYFLSAFIFRLVLPALMSASVAFRPCGLSVIYLLLMFATPFVPVPKQKTMNGSTGIYLKILIAVSIITTLSQIVFQIVLLAMQPYGHFLQDCELLEKILRHVGFVRLNNISPISALTWLSPEPLMLLISIISYVVLKKIVYVATPEETSEEGALAEMRSRKNKIKFLSVLVSIGRYLALLCLCLTAVLTPSVQGGFYFLVFLSASTWWACYRELGKKFAYFLRFMAAIYIIHMSVIYAYQFPWTREFVDTNSTYVRYFAITPILSVDCDSDPRDFIWSQMDWATFINPAVLYCTYTLIIILAKGLLKPQINYKCRRSTNPEGEPLMRTVSPGKRYGSSSRRHLIQDSTGSVTVTNENTEEIPMDQLGKGTTEEEYKPTIIETVIMGFEQVLQVIIRSSYIGTNIIMMAWSITYLSWITFVLLLWANILWLVPQQRKSMLRSSPFLVLYAWFLLISAYIYSMNLTEEELPSTIKGINLAQIGFVKVTVLPCNPLLVKSLFTVMFWITLRQYMYERVTAKQTSALADMVAPLQVTVGTATGVSTDQQQGSKLMDKIGKQMSLFLTKFWIWVVAITLFAVAITGQRMTMFRIVYMALFVLFVLSFQISFRVWRKMMFAFWLTVIVISMIILVMVYTYQFDNFQEYWEIYLHVPKTQQLDIGLEIFLPKQLLVRLATPTFFVIITVIQLHYFHKDFMELSDPKSNDVLAVDLDESSLQGGAGVVNSERDITTSTSIKFDLSDVGKISSAHFQMLVERWLKRMHKWMNLTYLFLEIHMPKVVMFFAMLMCVFDKCALYLVVIFLIVLGLTFGRPMMIVAIFASSVFASVMLLARMIYQIDYIEPAKWNVTCHFTNDTNGTIENNAQWFGFDKSDEEKSLPHLLKWNIIYILVVTLWAVINVRQLNYRLSRGKPTQRAYFMFPKITRNDADKDLTNCLKYLANFMFYKFGVEFSLMATVACIGFRMDLMAVLYSIWLIIICCCGRKTLSRIWNIYLIFIAVMLPIQYVMTLGLPPTLCIDYPWTHSEILRRVQEWAYLMDPDHPPSPKKLICDFIVLLFVSRQALVFRIESRNQGKNYTGGSNESIIHLHEDPSFKNPVPDFITYVRSYLDIFKRGALQGFLWITLAIVFLAGTNRVNIFSIGYLVGAFIFLWQGSDLYLWPIPRILKAWDYVIYYNVASIFLKVTFQIAGCVFIHELSDNACWMIQLFGIGCVRKFGNLVQELGFEDPGECKVPREFIGIVWDGLCFGFLIMQRRIFESYNFFHMVDETKATTILASRGADLIEELRQNRMAELKEQEHKVLEKIKVKMDRIKATQQKMQGSVYADSKGHYVDTVFENRPRRRRRPPSTYKQAIRSGDYYMFDDLEDDQVDVEPEPEPVDPDDPANKALKPNLGEIQEHERDEDDAPKHEQPSTSKDEELSDITEAQQLTFWQKLLSYLYLAWIFIEGTMVSMTNFLNQYSKDYRYVIRVLTKEKKMLKEKTKYNVGIRAGSRMVWQPAGSYHSLLRESRQFSELRTSIYDFEGEMSSYDQPTIVRLLLAIWYIIMSRSEILCYFIIFLNQIKSATFLSLPLPFMVFLWGSLTVPRPSKSFWVTIIAYTQIIVLLKCMFQFDIIPWNRNLEINTNPFYPPRIIGIERKQNYAVWDLLLLLVVFFHRFMLKSMGLWKSVEPVPAALLADGEYRLEDGRLVPTDCLPTSKTDKTATTSPDKTDRTDKTSSMVEDEDIDEDNIVSLQSNEVEASEDFPHIVKKATGKYTESIQHFFDQLLNSPTKQAADVYSYMFMCDFFNFFVILMGYSSFGAQQGDGGVSSYLEDNRVPALFLVMLILQFMLIIIDRGIFLRKNITAKLIFQFSQVILLHIWLFVLFPIMTGSRFNSVLPPQMYYMVKCFYLLLSAYQIRCGYPSRILGNFLCKGYGYFNQFTFKGFMLIPFLFELRTVMDWMWTDTSMTVFDWIKMEDIFAHIFQLKCTRHVEDEYPQARGERKNPTIKYMMGGGILAVIIGIIWFPLVFFSLGNAVGQPNPPYDVTLEIRIGPYEPVYQMSAQNNSIYQFSDVDLEKLMSVYGDRKSAVTFINNYEALDIAAVKLNTDSANIWSISPPDRQRMVNEIKSPKPITVRLEYKISHKTSKPEDSGVIPDNVEITVPAGTPENPNPVRENLLKMLNGENTTAILLEYLMPKFLKVTNRGTAKPITQLMDDNPVASASSYRNISLNLLRPENNSGSEKEWWQIHESCSDYNGKEFLSKLPYADCEQIIMYTFNDKIFPATLNVITGGGIIGLYTTLVFVASRVLRGFFAEQCFKIMFEDMPNVDRVLQLCLDIYLVREAREFILEEDLFAKLVFLFRSPETLIKWTRPKEELEDDEDPEGEEQ